MAKQRGEDPIFVDAYPNHPELGSCVGTGCWGRVHCVKCWSCEDCCECFMNIKVEILGEE